MPDDGKLLQSGLSVLIAVKAGTPRPWRVIKICSVQRNPMAPTANADILTEDIGADFVAVLWPSLNGLPGRTPNERQRCDDRDCRQWIVGNRRLNIGKDAVDAGADCHSGCVVFSVTNFFSLLRIRSSLRD